MDDTHSGQDRSPRHTRDWKLFNFALGLGAVVLSGIGIYYALEAFLSIPLAHFR